MKGELVFETLGGVDTRFILEADPCGADVSPVGTASNDTPIQKKKSPPLHSGWVAAMICLCVGLGIYGGMMWLGRDFGRTPVGGTPGEQTIQEEMTLSNDIAMQMYEAAIRDEISVWDERLGETKLKSLRFSKNDTTLDARKLLQKAIPDVDRDGVSEYVIQSPDHEHIILRYYNGKVYSYRLDACDFYKFNTDGTFYWFHSPESGVRECGLSKIVFDGEAINVKSIYSLTYSENPAQYEYFIEGAAVTEDEYYDFRNQNVRYDSMKFSQFEMSCSYPITAEQAWNLANAYWDHQDGRTDAGAGTIWTSRITLIDTPNAETDTYRVAFQVEWNSGGGLEGYECMPPYHTDLHDQILVNAFTGEITAATFDPNGKGVSIEEAMEIVKNDCDHINFDHEENEYRVAQGVNATAPDHYYVIVVQKYVIDHYSVYIEKWVDKNTGEITDPYYTNGK